MDEPAIPDWVDIADLPLPVRAELKSLPLDLAERVGGHLLAAGKAWDEEPGLALRHALAAKELAARLAVVREATAEAAYSAGEFEIAIREFRALRRMTGSGDYLPVIADCERALGRPREALRILAPSATEPMSPEQRVEALLVEAGARDDMGQRPEAIRLLRERIDRGQGVGLDRVMAAYARLLDADDDPEAEAWRRRAQEAEPSPDEQIVEVWEERGVVEVEDEEPDETD